MNYDTLGDMSVRPTGLRFSWRVLGEESMDYPNSTGLDTRVSLYHQDASVDRTSKRDEICVKPRAQRFESVLHPKVPSTPQVWYLDGISDWVVGSV